MPPVRLLPLGTTAPFSGNALCVYYKDYDTGDFYRVSLDGAIRERVLKGDKASTVRLSVDESLEKGYFRLNVGGIPRQAGFTVLDKASAGKRREQYDETTRSLPARFAFSDAMSNWTVTFHRRTIEIEPQHYHYLWDKVEFSRSGKSLIYDFNRESPEIDRVWLGDDEHAVVFDYPNVISWNLSSDARTCIAHGQVAETWPRDLHKAERFKPRASVGGRTWTIKSPDDVVLGERMGD